MDAKQEIDRLIKTYHGTRRETGKHYVYEFPGKSQKFTLSKTPGDYWSYHRSLIFLRRVLGIRPGPGDMVAQTENNMTMQDAMKTALAETSANHDTGTVTTAEITLAEPPKSVARQRIDSRIEELERDKRDLQNKVDDLMRCISAVDADLEKMAKFMILCDDPGMEDMLSTLMDDKAKRARPMSPQATESRKCQICGIEIRGSNYNLKRHVKAAHGNAAPKPTPPPTEAVTRGVDVNKQLVLACTQTFDTGEVFSTRQVIDRMVGDAEVDAREASRIAVAVSSAVAALEKEGLLTSVVRAQGRRPATWRKVDLTRLRDMKGEKA